MVVVSTCLIRKCIIYHRKGSGERSAFPVSSMLLIGIILFFVSLVVSLIPTFSNFGIPDGVAGAIQYGISWIVKAKDLLGVFIDLNYVLTLSNFIIGLMITLFVVDTFGYILRLARLAV